MFKRFWAILRARLLEYRRDKSAMVWSFIFPLALVSGFGLMFSGDDREIYKVGLLGEGKESVFMQTKHIQFIDYIDSDKAQLKLSQHRLDLVIDINGKEYWVNEYSANGYIIEKLLINDEPQFTRQVHNGKQIRYIDWVVPGILGMNIMFGSFFGVGFAIVRYRRNSVLKRLHATPLTAFEFILAQMVSRLIIVMFTISIVFTICNFLFDFYMIGSYFNLLVMAMLGALSMISMALIIAARLESQEGANGLLNLMSWPMMILSGTWFSLEGAPQWLQDVGLIVPLTHALKASREIMFNGATLWDVRTNIMALLVITAVLLFVSSLRFRWHGSGR